MSICADGGGAGAERVPGWHQLMGYRASELLDWLLIAWLFDWLSERMWLIFGRFCGKEFERVGLRFWEFVRLQSWWCLTLELAVTSTRVAMTSWVYLGVLVDLHSETWISCRLDLRARHRLEPPEDCRRYGRYVVNAIIWLAPAEHHRRRPGACQEPLHFLAKSSLTGDFDCLLDERFWSDGSWHFCGLKDIGVLSCSVDWRNHPGSSETQHDQGGHLVFWTPYVLFLTNEAKKHRFLRRLLSWLLRKVTTLALFPLIFVLKNSASVPGQKGVQ